MICMLVRPRDQIKTKCLIENQKPHQSKILTGVGEVLQRKGHSFEYIVAFNNVNVVDLIINESIITNLKFKHDIRLLHKPVILVCQAL